MIDAEAFIAQHGTPIAAHDAVSDVAMGAPRPDALEDANDDGHPEDHNQHDARSHARSWARGKAKRAGRSWARGAGAKGVAASKERPSDPCDEDACREAALRLLDRADRSSAALLERLVLKGYDETVADAVVARLREVGLVNDEEYARSVVRYCAGRMLGERGTLLELSRKRVDRALSQQVVSEAREAGVFVDAAWELGRSVAARTAGLDLQVRRRRFWAAGGRKGHSPDILRDISHSLFDKDA